MEAVTRRFEFYQNPLSVRAPLAVQDEYLSFSEGDGSDSSQQE
jgi:hypothetical protein